MNTLPAPEPDACLAPTTIIDSDHGDVIRFAREHGHGDTDRERAVALYYAVRDLIRYDAYGIDLTPHGLSASHALATGRGWCVSKSVLLAAACRVLGIPAGLGYADVRNHLSTERLRASMGTDIFYWHGYTSIWLDNTWLKATPAFNRELCTKFRIRTLEFDGRADSIYHPFDEDGRQHMEYLNYRGEFSDVPLAAMRADFLRYYPQLGDDLQTRDFDREVEAEVAASAADA